MQQISVEEWLNKWLETYIKPPCRKENTYLCYKYVIQIMKKAQPDLLSADLTDVREWKLQKLLIQAADNYAKSTVKKIKTVLKRSYEVAIRNHICTENPAISLSIPESAAVKEVRALTRQEEIAIRKAAEKDILGHLAIFMLDTGVRSSELRHLKWHDYNAEKNEIYVRKSKTKNGIRVVPLLTEAKDIIEKQPHCCEYIFVSTIKKPVTKTVLSKLYLRLRKATGINMLTNHVYRHSFATRAVEKQIDYKALSKILGHKNVAFTLQRYTNAETGFLHEQMHKMEKNQEHKSYHVIPVRLKRR